MVSPVIQLPSAEATNDTAAAMSSGRPTRPSGVRLTTKSIVPWSIPAMPSVVVRPGAMADDADLAGPKFQREAAREHVDCALGRAVNLCGRHWGLGYAGADVDNHSAFSWEETSSRLRGEDQALDVQPILPVDALRGNGVETAKLVDTGVVHQDIELFVLLNRCIEEGLDLFRL